MWTQTYNDLPQEVDPITNPKYQISGLGAVIRDHKKTWSHIGNVLPQEVEPVANYKYEY